jgi:hypothetical protein
VKDELDQWRMALADGDYPFMEMQVRYYVLNFCTAVGLNAFAARQQGREWHFSDQPAASAYVSNRG